MIQMSNFPAWVQLVGGAVLGVFIIGGVYASMQGTLASQSSRLDLLEKQQKEDKYLADRVLTLEQWRKNKEQQEEKYLKTQESLVDAVQSLNVNIAKWGAILEEMRREK